MLSDSSYVNEKPGWFCCLMCVLYLVAIVAFGTAFWWFVLVAAAPLGGW